jgi:hypothetical protein
MLIDTRYFKEHTNFESKFLRVGNEIYITQPNDVKTFHVDLAKIEKVLDRIEFFRRDDQDSIDGGRIFVYGRTIQIGSASSTLSLPLTQKARRETVKKIKDLYPEFLVQELVA